jgi:hypothetical protein
MPQVEFEPMIAVFDSALDRSATVISLLLVKKEEEVSGKTNRLLCLIRHDASSNPIAYIHCRGNVVTEPLPSDDRWDFY